ncbi:hypothetical protein [Stomatohabitans albus]|uniref:hypothetical protein n=1 Tax=Stomatohabitans albus TaxID=3110766 RepID=UPI00300C9B9A
MASIPYADYGLLFIGIISAITAFIQWREQKHRNSIELASGLTAWWAKSCSNEGDLWGVIIYNATSLSFYDIEIKASGNFNPNAKPIQIQAIPPGRFYIEGKHESDTYDWGFPKEIRDYAHSNYEAIVCSKNHTIRQMRYSDFTNKKWIWSPERGITSS